ncbi:MAG: helix-turn-helix transcriptional regulator [Lachnospiraceae bacterium]
MSNLQLSKNLRTLRKARRLTQTHLSIMLNISRQAYSNYENNKRTPDLDSLIRLSQIYHITLDQLVNQNAGQTLLETTEPYYPALNIQTGDTLYLTKEETDLVMQYRDLSQPGKEILQGFFESRISHPQKIPK